MGEGVTNPVGGAASSSSVHSTAEVVLASLLSADRFETGLQLIVFVSLACVFAARWMSSRRKYWAPTTPELTHSQSGNHRDTYLCGSEEHSSHSCASEANGGAAATGLTSKSEPHLRRSEIVCETGRTVPSLVTVSEGENTPDPSQTAPDFAGLDRCASDQPADAMDASDDVPSQPDSFFTWDSGGSSGEYSFVHTAVELPKYPDGAISEEERQMLLLYMQTGHPELLLTPSQARNVGPAPGPPDSVLCDPAAGTRGFLETIVEENSDDLRSPSECDEASVGWGSWDESDEDRMTVVEMVTSASPCSGASPGLVYTSADLSSDRGVASDQCSSVGLNPDQPISLSETELLAGEDPHSDSASATFNYYDRLRDDVEPNPSLGESSDAGSQQVDTLGVCGVDNKMTPRFLDVFRRTETGEKPGNLDACPQQGVSPILDSLVASNINDCFDTLWISADRLESPSETLNPFAANRFLESDTIAECDDSVLFLGSEDICLIPSPSVPQNAKQDDPETLMFSDNFKDYFLPANYVPGFSKDTVPDLDELAKQPSLISPDDFSDRKEIRCFRIGFDPFPTEQFSLSHLDASMICGDAVEETRNDYDLEVLKTEGDLQDTMFSPVEGDIVYGSSWVSSRPLKEPEKTSSGAEVLCSAAQTDIRRSPTIRSESPPQDNNRRSFDHCASDDDTLEVPSSLSRWRHHTDLQHLQEGTSPITRWQHETDLQNLSACKQTESEESDDGLPPQLKEIYSSFKMRDNKMGRIRIKEDKNNNFKRLGLWDNESKVTLPPFGSNSTETEKITPKPKECNGAGREELDDLDIDMFAVAKSGASPKPPVSSDSDVDDALRSFNHLNDYTSDENSENENAYPVNVTEKSQIVEPETNLADAAPSSLGDQSTETSLKTHCLSPENPCSDNSDNCPFCSDPSFRSSRMNDLFSLKGNEGVEQDVQSLLQKTYPKMIRLSQCNLSDPEIHELAANSGKAADSMSPLTSSDSDEGNRKVKEVKKRVKKRSKENTNTELKHDDSGYVEDDEDDDDEEEDSLGEKKEKRSSSTRTSNPDIVNQSRKSLSTAFYESRSLKPEGGYPIPESFQEFSKQLEQSMTAEELKAEFLNAEKWDIPENLSQFSAWLLDKELKKISNRDEMEKLLVDDIMSLREQTITKFLKNSCSAEDEINPKSSDLPPNDESEASPDTQNPNCIKSNDNLDLEHVNTTSDEKELINNSKENSPTLESETSNLSEINFISEANDPNPQSTEKKDSDEIKSIENQTSQIQNQASDDSSSSNDKTDSDELNEEYYNYNFNRKVTQVFSEESNRSNPTETVADVSEPSLKENKTVPSSFTTERESGIEESREEKVPQLIDTREAEITHTIEPATTCYNNCERSSSDLEHNGPADFKTDSSELKPVTDNAEVFNSNELEAEASITPCSHPSASKDTVEIQRAKVNDTTIHPEPVTEKEEKALPEIISSHCPQVAPSIGSIDIQNPGTDPETVSHVAPSDVEETSYFDGSGLAGAEFDLMTQGVASEEKGAFEGCVRQEADDISSLEAVAVSRESDGETHVQTDACHAHRQDGTALGVSENSDVSAEIESGVVNSDNSALHSKGVTEDDSLSIANVNIVECCVPVAVTPETDYKVSAGFTTLDCYAATEAGVCVVAENENRSDADLPSVEPDQAVSDQCSFDDLEISPCHQFACENNSDREPENAVLFKDVTTTALDDELIVGESSEKEFLQPSEHIPVHQTESNKPDIVSCCEDESEAASPDIPAFRSEYKRSNSLGREPEAIPEPIGVQSKSTPDLRRCHEQQLRSSAPLSALLSKSVSQRIQDYLGRGDRLLRSLPPNERSRHYRRICVSTETVVERAARFEARSQSNRPAPRDKSPFSARSGSCPPSSMRHNTSWITERNHSKPTATVRPTIDTHRNGIHKLTSQKDGFLEMVNGYSHSKNGGIPHKISADPPSKENFMEMITGYNKATKVTHKPPVPPTAHQSTVKTVRLKGKIASARKDFFERISQPDLSVSTDSVQQKESQQQEEDDPSCLNRFDEFRRSARAERARLAASHPDLGALEAAVRSSKRRIDQLKKKKRPEPPQQQMASMPSTKELCLPYRRCTGEIAWASCAQRVREATGRRKQLQQLEIVDQRDFPEGAVRAHSSAAEDDDDPASTHSAIAGGALEFLGSRARSMDFLLDADNRERALPPENRLSTSGGGARVKSEHELRIERSLQNLTIPDWYKQSAWSKKPKEGFILRRGSEGSAGESRKRWQGFSSSRTPSATSLTTTPTSYSQRNIVVPKRVTPTSGGDWRHVGSLVSSRESLTPASPASLSPREGAFQYTLSTSSLSRWSSSRLSTSSAPLTALSVHRSFRQPYLGWRAAAASSGYTPSSGGGSRSSPGVSPVNATTPLQGSRPESPRRGSQEHPFAYGLQQNQITSAATLRPDGSESTDTSRISPLALNTTNVFFSSNVEGPDTYETAPPNRFATVEMRRDRYSYTQSLYSGTVIVSPGTADDDRRNYNLDQLMSTFDGGTTTPDERFGMVRSPQPPPRIWMESSFVGTKKDGSEPVPNTRSIRIVPSDGARVGANRLGTSATGSVRGGTCATQTAMGEYQLRDFRRFGITL